MPIMFHGTTKENANSILKNGFNPHTYFSHDLATAYKMGGDYVFEVLFKKSPNQYWEWISKKRISPKRIIRLVKYTGKELFLNRLSEEILRKDGIKEWRKENNLKPPIFCKKCKARGQINEIPFGKRWKDLKEIVVCDRCNGHGVLNPYDTIT